MQAMILAAGFGTRLLPYTRLRPKPLFPLLNEPLLLLTIRRLQAAGFDRIIVNCHYLREQIVAALDDLSGVIIQEEETVLGTGGGLRMAMGSLRNEPLLVTNGDIYHTVSFSELYHSHDPEHFGVTMGMHDYPRFNKVTVQENRVTSFDNEGAGRLMAFTGLHVLNPELLQTIPEKKEYSIIDRYRELLQEGESIQALHVDGCSWTDMGCVEDYLALHGRLLHREIPLWEEFSSPPRSPFHVSKNARGTKQACLEDWACIGCARLEQGSKLKRCVVWDHSLVERGGEHVDQLIVPQTR
ncbi:MAG: sugar phosphate nucleotidyltransferase [Thermodesulfobacteriota bacterium]